METSFFTGFGHFCRFICIIIFAVIGINATLDETPPTVNDNLAAAGKVISFKGETTKNKKIALKWKLNKDVNYTYSVEKSRDGQNFTEMETKTIELQDNGDYTWTDPSPRMVNCYRLKMTDEAGKVSYSKTMVLQMYRSGEVESACATPDLNLNDINVDLDLKSRAMVTMNIVDKNGTIVMQQKEHGSEGMNNFRIKGSSKMAPGDYFLNVAVNGDDKLTVHLVKS
jgi:hypothetical protein